MRLLLGKHTTLLSCISFYLLISAALSADQLKISWNDNSANESGFKVERSLDGVTYESIGTVGANVTSYADTKVTAGTKYWYRVCAYDSTACSAYSNVTSLSVPALTTVPPPSTSAAVPSRLARVSTKANAGPWGGACLRLTFGIANNSKSILLRGIGPGLASYTTATTLTNPKLSLYDGLTLLNTNDNWGGTAELSTTFTQVGAFALSTTSQDAAILTTLSAKTYAAEITGKRGGMALAEIYDADTAAVPIGQLTKVTVRAPVGTGENVLVAGFAIVGDTSLHVLVRAIGPSQSGLQGVLKDPQIEIYHGSTVVKRNDNWGGSSTMSALFVKSGASSLLPHSKDAAVDITLAAGTYSAVVSGVNNSSGIVRLEFYVVP